MADALFLVATILFFVVAVIYVALCDRAA